MVAQAPTEQRAKTNITVFNQDSSSTVEARCTESDKQLALTMIWYSQARHGVLGHQVDVTIYHSDTETLCQSSDEFGNVCTLAIQATQAAPGQTH